MSTMEMAAIATMPMRTNDCESTYAASDGTNAVSALAKHTRANAPRSGFRLPERSAIIVRMTPRRDTARTPANTELICPSVRSSDVRANGSVCDI